MTNGNAGTMSASRFVRWAAIGTLIGSAAWAALSVESIVRPDPEDYRNALMLVPWLLSAGGITGLYIVQKGRSGRLGIAGFWATIVAMAATAAGLLASLAGLDALDPLLFPAGPLAWIAGMLVLGIATIRAGVVPRPAGWALILAEPATILTGLALSPWVPLADDGSYSGAIANGIAFLIVGLALRGVSWEEADVAPGRAVSGHLLSARQ